MHYSVLPSLHVVIDCFVTVIYMVLVVVAEHDQLSSGWRARRARWMVVLAQLVNGAAACVAG